MRIHLSEVLTSPERRCVHELNSLEFFYYHNVKCRVKMEKAPVLELVRTGEDRILIRLSGDAEAVVPCDRCFEDTVVSVSLEDEFEVSLRDEMSKAESGDEPVDAADQVEDLSTSVFISDHELDSDKLLRQELSLKMPEKILCKEDCAGLCPKCGKNLNKGPCDCKEEPVSLQMAGILDLFNNSKEV
ncbi:MAG: DUF177 domain-containing protein [Lachnospiraceae bacterium]|nr:DUF177 domain-containing protein [Lachnospiraceae bacterium]